MIIYNKLGKIPQKRHTQFRQPDGSLYKEELYSTQGFDGIYTNAYHINSPAKILEIEDQVSHFLIQEWEDAVLKPYHFKTYGHPADLNFVTGRKPLMFNENVILSVSRPLSQMKDFYRTP